MAESKRTVYEKAMHDTSFRRTWDKEDFERRARERARQEREQEEDEDRKRKGLKPKYSESSISDQPRDLLRARTERVILDANLNKTQVVQSTSIASKQPGFYCKECDCVVKDSVNYLDHINGKKHQIKAKFEQLKKKKEEEQQIYEKAQRQEEEEKRRKKERKKAKKRNESKKNDKEEGAEDDIDPEMAKLMGYGEAAELTFNICLSILMYIFYNNRFGGFGTTKS
ncbi:5353_t:CDS:2 [Racocetra fulgida]|uniref:5353_t:CDS:1 n=1 Tax=Racocetra fulgida TaxID=60492 RepID=A0A9N9B994_9GLOM|nr:5353_t:CDS:2 [Racocetra fulgida]